MKMTIIKVSILAIGIATLVIIALSSCSTTRRSGCPDTWNMVGYK